MDKIIVVIGANGFVGSSIVEKLAADLSNKIYCFDRFNSENRIEPKNNIVTVQGDYFSDADIDQIAFKDSYVIQCLSVSNPSSSISDPYLDIDLLKRNVEVFYRLVNAGVKKIGYISSGGAVYGNVGEGDVADENYPANPISPYGIGKRATELYLDYVTKNSETSYMVFRLSNPYGGSQEFKNGSGVIPKFIASIKNNEPLRVIGDGSASRDYVHISDASNMIITALLSDKTNKIYNIGSGVQTSLNELITILIKGIGTEVPITYEIDAIGYPKKTPISITSFVNDFGMPEFRSIEESLPAILSKY